MRRYGASGLRVKSFLFGISMLFSNNAADDTDRVRVKFCGFTREDDVVAAVDAGADAVGFVCYPKSTRYVTPSRLMSLVSMVPESVTPVLLFVNPTAEEVREHIGLFPQVTLQFHGTESRAFCDQFHMPYIKAVHMQRPEQLLQAEEEYPMAAGILADAPSEIWGGSGTSFDWLACSKVRAQLKKPLIVAGGLREINVYQAIKTLHPWAVDVASGIETARGIKDPAKIFAFMQAVRRGGQANA